MSVNKAERILACKASGLKTSQHSSWLVDMATASSPSAVHLGSKSQFCEVGIKGIEAGYE